MTSNRNKYLSRPISVLNNLPQVHQLEFPVPKNHITTNHIHNVWSRLQVRGMGRQGQGLCPRQDAVGGVQAKDLGGGEKVQFCALSFADLLSRPMSTLRSPTVVSALLTSTFFALDGSQYVTANDQQCAQQADRYLDHLSCYRWTRGT